MTTPALCPRGHRTFHDIPEGSCVTVVCVGRGSYGYASGPCDRVAQIVATFAVLEQAVPEGATCAEEATSA